MKETTRKMGIDVIDAAPWGTHLCLFYDTKQDLIDILVPYFKTGLENNEFCIWITSEPLGKKGAEEVMRQAVPNFAQYVEKRQIEIVPYIEWYLKDGAFNSQRVLNAWIDKLDQALAKGYEGMRVTGDESWLEEKIWGDFTSYEEAVNKVIGNYKMLAICTYSLAKCGVSEIIDVVGNHQFALIKRGGKYELIESSKDRRAEEELQASMRKYRALFDNMLDGFAYCKIIVDKNNKPIDFVYLEVNDAFERLTGLRKEDVIDRKVTEAIPEIKESHPELFSIYGKVALGGEGTKFDIYFKPLAIWLTISVYSPQHGYFVALFENITEFKQMEETLKESENMSPKARSGEGLTFQQERFVKSGFESFTDQEIIELLLGLTLPYREAKQLAKECLVEFKDLSGFVAASSQELERIGIAPSSIIYIKLLHELPAEILKKKIVEQPFYKSSKEVFDYLYYSMRDLKKEVLKAVHLNSRSEIMDIVDLFEGTLKSIPISPRVIMESAMKEDTAGIILVHNHPSGDPAPSQSDKQFTRDLVFVGSVIQVNVLDHIIIGDNNYFSFADEGLIKKYELDFLNLRIRSLSDKQPGF